MMNTKVNLAGVELKNPVMTASGTFGSGAEYGEMVDLNSWEPLSPREWPISHGPGIRHPELQRHTGG